MTADALLLAAGFGLRLRPLTLELPKALLPIYGTPLLDLHLERLTGEARTVVVNGHHLADQIRDHVNRHPQHGRIRFSHEAGKIRGTGGAIVAARSHLESDPFLVVNADAIFPAPWKEAIAAHRASGALATMILTPSLLHPNVRVEGNRVTEIRIGGLIAGGMTFTGCHVITRSLITRLPSRGFHDIRDTYQELIGSGQLGAFVAPRSAELLDIGTPARYLEAHRRLPPPADVPTVAGYGYIDPTARVGTGARIAESVVLPGAILAPGSTVLRSILGPGVQVTGAIEDLLVTRCGTQDIAG